MRENQNQKGWTLEQLKEGYEAMAAINLALCRDYEALEDEAGQTVDNTLR